MQIAPDMIVRHTINGRYYKVRSVSRTKAVCVPCTKTGRKPSPGFRAVAVQFDIARLEPVTVPTRSALGLDRQGYWRFLCSEYDMGAQEAWDYIKRVGTPPTAEAIMEAVRGR